MSDLDDRIRSMLEDVQRTVPPEPPFPLSPLRPREEIQRMRRVATAVVAGAVVLGIWLVVVVLARPPAGELEPGVVSAPGTTSVAGGGGGSQSPPAGGGEVRSVQVAGAGPYVEDVLQGHSLDFYRETGYGIQFELFGSMAEVWRLHDDAGTEVDVVEVGFRLEALAGLADEHFLPIDESAVPALDRVPDWLGIDANGIVPGIEGALGLIHVPGQGDPPGSWVELVAMAEDGRAVVIPGPPLSLAVVFVHAMGEGSVDVGLELYANLVAAGAIPARTTAEFQQALADGAVAGAWSSNGAVASDRSITFDADFLVPDTGAVVLPTFAGILETAAAPDAAMAWLEFRLREPQESMTFGEIISMVDGPPPSP